MASGSRKKLQADLASLKARLAATSKERDLMKAVSDELHSKVLGLETALSSRVAGPHGEAGGRIMPAERAAPEAELAEARAKAERLAERVAELRLQLSVFAPDNTEAATRAGESLVRARQTGERIQTLERQLATARAREENLVSQSVRNEATIADLEARVLEMSGLEARSVEAEIARADAEEALTEMQTELLMLRVEVERLRKDRDEARQRAEAERALAAADRLRADEAQRMAEMGARSGDLESALGRVAELEADLARARVFAQETPAVAVDSSELVGLLAERDDLQAMLYTAQARLSALEEVAAHAAILESEMSDARARMPEMKIAADAAARRAAELSEALHIVESERDALRSALEGRVRDMNDLRTRVGELEATPSEGASLEEAVQPASAGEPPQEELRRSGSGVASIWLSEGVGGTVEALVDLRDTETGLGSEPVSSGGDDSSDVSEPSQPEDEPEDATDEAGSDMASAGFEVSSQGWVHRRGKSLRKHPPEDPTSWT